MAVAQLTTPLSAKHEPLLERAELLRWRLRLAASEAGLTSGAHSHSPTLSKPFDQVPSLHPSSSASSSSLTVSPAPTMSLYESLFGRHFQFETIDSKERGSPVMRLTALPIPSLPSQPSSSPSSAVASKATLCDTRSEADVRPQTPIPQDHYASQTARERLARVASAPQLGSPHHRTQKSSDLHNYPTSELLLREQKGVADVSHKRRRLASSTSPQTSIPSSSSTFRFPAPASSSSSSTLSSPPFPVSRQAHGSRQFAGLNGHRSASSASAASHGLGVACATSYPATFAPRRVPISHSGHVRNASMPEARRAHDHYVPIRGSDPVPSTATLSSSAASRTDLGLLCPPADPAQRHAHISSAPHDNHVPRSHVRTQGRHLHPPQPGVRSHRRSISHSTVELSRPVFHSHDRNDRFTTPLAGVASLPTSNERGGSITTPPAGAASLPDTPKSMGSKSLNHGDYLVMSPSPEPHTHTRDGYASRQAIKPSTPQRHAVARMRMSEVPNARSVCPLWAQSSPR